MHAKTKLGEIGNPWENVCVELRCGQTKLEMREQKGLMRKDYVACLLAEQVRSQ